MHPQSLGSGFIISDDGYILTNHHVIDKAEKVLVRLNDRREIEAEIVGSDQRSDVALLKVDAKDLPALDIGSSSELEVGEWVLAIGSPFGFDSTVTAGIVSAKERALPGDSYVPFIQTDVAINPGNSGGPLFNLDGEVVGINSQIYTRSGGFMGVSFSIPIDVAMEVANQLKDKGSVSRGWLGVIIQEVTRDLAESFGLDKPSGALVAQVLSDSPAEEAGFEAGDVILKFNGREIGLSAELPAQVGRIAPGETADVEVFRSGRSVNLKVTIGELPSNEELASNRLQPEPKEKKSLGLVVQDMTADIQERTGVDTGVYVESVGQGPAGNAGVRQGDVITMLAGRSVTSVDQLSNLVADLPGDRAVPLRVIRNGNPVFLAMRLE
jgi:serine protease Do